MYSDSEMNRRSAERHDQINSSEQKMRSQGNILLSNARFTAMSMQSRCTEHNPVHPEEALKPISRVKCWGQLSKDSVLYINFTPLPPSLGLTHLIGSERPLIER